MKFLFAVLIVVLCFTTNTYSIGVAIVNSNEKQFLVLGELC
jgi:hypothetical protein